MESSGGDAAVRHLRRDEERDGYCELEHLPPLLEDEENVSLADILSLRDSCLSEEEVWAVCAECVLALQSIRPSTLFHTLCITPDTLAFNAHGNVSFMEQLSDDPEGSFVPPEFDNTGSTFEGHVYSLGSTLSAALSFIIEPELEAELGEEIQRLLEQMQEEKPEDRPLLQDVLSLAEAKLPHTSSSSSSSSSSSAAVCRKLSSVGRRVLSIESVSTFQDGQEVSWEARWQHPKPRTPSSDHKTKVTASVDGSVRANGPSRQQVCGGWDSSLWDEDGGGDALISADYRSHYSSLLRPSRVRGALNRSCSVPDSNNPPCLSPPPHGDISVPVSDLTEIGADKHSAGESAWSTRLHRLDRGQSCDSYPPSSAEDRVVEWTWRGNEDAAKTSCSGGETEIQGSQEWESKDSASSCTSCQDLDLEQDSCEDQVSLNHSLYIPNNYMTKSMLCLNEESQDEWISLRDLLTRCGRRLTVNELWSLCYTCLSSLQTYIDFPAYLCLDTLHVGCEGEVLFLNPKNIGPRDDFYLAPEYQDHGIVTEKVCVYGVAAVLWATAKFRLSPHQMLAVPRQLKRLLLEMAKRTPMERPTIVMAKKSCRDYLSRRGTSAETVWSDLVGRVHPSASKSSDAEDSSESRPNSGFVPTATESRLAPVPGPVPHSFPLLEALGLPEAFTSAATHFSPIVLTGDGDSEGGSRRRRAAGEGTVVGFTNSHEHTEESPQHPTRIGPEPDPHPQEPLTSALPDVSLPPPLPTNLGGCGVFNNYLLRQDPVTGLLSLVPMRIRAPESLLGLDIDLSLVPGPLRGLMEVPQTPGGPLVGSLNVSSSYFNGSSVTDYNGHTSPGSQGEHQDPSETGPPRVHPPGVHPSLQEVIELLKGEFSLDGCLDNGHEDISMGEYIFSLKDLQYRTFASVVKESFRDLYWEDDLLAVLHRLVHYSPSALEKPPSKAAVTRAALATPSPAAGDVEKNGRLDLNGNIEASDLAAADQWEGAEGRPCDGGRQEDAMDESGLRSEEERRLGPGESSDTLLSALMEGGGERWEAAGDDESPSEGLSGVRGERASPDCSEDMEDADSVASERLPSPGSGSEGPGPCLNPAWALAFYGEECFGPEVVRYAANLGQHSGPPGLDMKTQELQQQMMMETKNLKKTRNFYHKLIQQERKNKDNKVMLSKLKTQHEELRSKVLFLDSVKKYLEVLSVDRWGLEVSLLSSLAVCGPDSVEFLSSEDPSVLSFGTGKGKSTLQAGSPRGLMAYLYSRNAAVEGFIQQFLYTYRFLCTAEQLLHFIMEKFIMAARRGPDLSGDGEKIFHRSLDLLQFWISDCKRVDFTPKSSLVETLETFLNTEVIPVDGRGDALLALLHSPPPSAAPIRGRESLVSFEEDDESVCLHSSTEDLGRKWRFSRGVEPTPALPKDRAFSIAAALPVPCYGSLLDDLANVCLQGEERLPFSQSESSAQHISQQLTLLQQGMFQGCHPVNFLNSRMQGIRDNVATHNKNVSQPVPPADGGGSLDGEESDSFLQRLLTYADSVANWISAEVVICDSVKTQVSLLTKYLWIGKYCYESRNFATAMQILGGLENVIVRQLPAWKHLSTKVCEILEELRAVQVFLKSDDLCLAGGEQARRRRPTLPAAHILAMHVQQLEIGAFTLTTGAFKWTKLRSIAKVVSQVHACQEAAYPYSPDPELQAYLRRRIARLATSDIHLLAADNDANFQPSSERETRRIQDKLRRVKATLQ